MKIFLSISANKLSSILIELRHSLQLDILHKWIFIYWIMFSSQAITKYIMQECLLKILEVILIIRRIYVQVYFSCNDF